MPKDFVDSGLKLETLTVEALGCWDLLCELPNVNVLGYVRA